MLRYRWGLSFLILAALAGTALPTTAAITRPQSTEPAWPAVGQSLQYLAAAGTDPQAALITSVPRPALTTGTSTAFPVVQVQVFPPTGVSFPATVGYCADTGYPCLTPLP